MSTTVSQARIDANRRNAQKSIGPRTPEGKARSSMNAVQHGHMAASIVVDDFRYESMIDRQLNRAQTELRRLKQEKTAIMAELRQMSRPVPMVKAQNEAIEQRAASAVSPTAATFPCTEAGRQSSVPNPPTRPDLSSLRLGSPSDTKAQNKAIARSPAAATKPGSQAAGPHPGGTPSAATGSPVNQKSQNEAIASLPVAPCNPTGAYLRPGAGGYFSAGTINSTKAKAPNEATTHDREKASRPTDPPDPWEEPTSIWSKRLTACAWTRSGTSLLKNAVRSHTPS